MHISKLLGSSNFELYLHSLSIQANFAKLAEALDLSNISSEYYKFSDIFRKTKAKVFTLYHPYNLKINLEEDAQPLVDPIYSLLAFEQEAFKKLLRKTLIWVLSDQPHLHMVY